MITLVGGNLYQWDTGRVVSIVSENGSVIHEVHFTTNAMNFAYVVKTQVKDTTTYCPIPDILLQQYSDIYCYEVKENCKGEESVSTKILPVQKRNRPEDYTYTEPEKITLEGLQDQIDAFDEKLDDLRTSITDVKDVAQSAKSGVDNLNNRYESLSSKLDTEASTREQADIKLQTEVDDLNSNYESLSSKLDAEISAREQAGTKLQTEVNDLKKDVANNAKEISQLKEIPDIAAAKTALQIGGTSLTEEYLKDLLDLADNGGVPYSETTNSVGGITAKIGIALTETKNSAGGITASIG